MKIEKSKKFKGNPRKITDRQKELLKEHISELGDLSGVVYCRNNKAYVGGNQRSDIFDGCEIEIIETFEIPTETGTVAHGFILFNNEKYVYREVDFSEEQFKKACIVANNDGGSFDWDILKDWDTGDLNDWGLDMPEFEFGDEELESDYSQKNKEIDTDEFSDKMEMKFEFTSDEFQFVQHELSKIDANKENALLNILGYEL